MSYVDGFVFAVPNKNIKAYKKMASEGKKLWMKHGALQYMECMGDDMKPAHVTFTFAKMLKLKKTETAFFSFIVYKSRKHRDAVNKKVMADPSMNENEWKDKPMPFEMKRMAMAGFEGVVEA